MTPVLVGFGSTVQALTGCPPPLSQARRPVIPLASWALVRRECATPERTRSLCQGHNSCLLTMEVFREVLQGVLSGECIPVRIWHKFSRAATGVSDFLSRPTCGLMFSVILIINSLCRLPPPHGVNQTSTKEPLSRANSSRPRGEHLMKTDCAHYAPCWGWKAE